MPNSLGISTRILYTAAEGGAQAGAVHVLQTLPYGSRRTTDPNTGHPIPTSRRPRPFHKWTPLPLTPGALPDSSTSPAMQGTEPTELVFKGRVFFV